jgi:hypothetical protein
MAEVVSRSLGALALTRSTRLRCCAGVEGREGEIA